MDVSKYQFDDDEIEKLHNYRGNQPDVRLKVRFITLLMLAKGVELKTIASIIGKSSTLTKTDPYSAQTFVRTKR